MGMANAPFIVLETMTDNGAVSQGHEVLDELSKSRRFDLSLPDQMI